MSIYIEGLFIFFGFTVSIYVTLYLYLFYYHFHQFFGIHYQNYPFFLFPNSMELHKNLTLDPTSNPSSTATAMTLTSTPPMAIPLTQLVKPSPLALAATAVPASTATLFAATDLNNFSSQSRIKPLTTKIRSTGTGLSSGGGLENGSKNKLERKFAPY